MTDSDRVPWCKRLIQALGTQTAALKSVRVEQQSMKLPLLNADEYHNEDHLKIRLEGLPKKPLNLSGQ